MTDANARILCIDDEPNVLDGLQRNLRRKFDVATAVGSKAGLERFEADRGFAVVVSDLRMPDMDGIELLSRIRELSPDTTRILLTGNADLTAAIEAVNRGSVFRFLSKPCPAADLVAAIERGVEQHRLVTAERVLLEQTLLGVIRMLTEVLALANPTAFGRAMRVKQRAGATASRLEGIEKWKIEMAAMLSQVACITLPAETAARLYEGEALSDADLEMTNRLPEIAVSLLESIPRMDDVREILRQQHAAGRRAPELAEVAVGARLLRIVLDFDALESQGRSVDEAILELRWRFGPRNADVVDALAFVVEGENAGDDVRTIAIVDLESGMVLIDPVEATDGRLIVARSQKVSASLIERLRNFSKNMKLKEPIRVRSPRL